MRQEEISAKDEVIEILRECLTEKVQNNSRYSARAFARDIQVSPAFISMLLAGKKKLSLDRARQVSFALEMSDRRRHNFLRLVALSSLPTRSSSTQDLEKLLFNGHDRKDIFPLEVDQFKFFCNWYYIAILDLTACRNFKSEVSWIADRLELSPLVVQDAIKRLLRLKLLKRVRGRLKKTNNHVAIPTSAPNSSIRNFHHQMIDKAKAFLNQQGENDFRRRDISAITIAIDPRKMEEAKKRINEFKNQMAEFLGGHCTEVYQLNLQFFPLSKPENKEEKP